MSGIRNDGSRKIATGARCKVRMTNVNDIMRIRGTANSLIVISAHLYYKSTLNDNF